jgi:hypothetical protein
MKTKVLLLTLALGASTCLLTAQDGNPRPDGQRPPGRQGGPGGMRMPMPIIEALDLNKDGTIDADEIAKATASLKKLDKNGDGKITAEEYRPQRPEGQGERRGPGGAGGAGGGEGRPQRPRSE